MNNHNQKPYHVLKIPHPKAKDIMMVRFFLLITNDYYIIDNGKSPALLR